MPPIDDPWMIAILCLVAGIALPFVPRRARAFWAARASRLPGRLGYLAQMLGPIETHATPERSLRIVAALKKSATPLALVGPDGVIVLASDALIAFLGLSPEQLRQPFAAWTLEDFLDADLALFESLVRGERREYEVVKGWRRGDGYPVYGRLHAMLAYNGEPGRFYVIATISPLMGPDPSGDVVTVARVLEAIEGKKRLARLSLEGGGCDACPTSPPIKPGSKLDPK